VYIPLCALKHGSINVNLQSIVKQKYNKEREKEECNDRRERVGSIEKRVRGRKNRDIGREKEKGGRREIGKIERDIEIGERKGEKEGRQCKIERSSGIYQGVRRR
jgi:hypothetical protein